MPRCRLSIRIFQYISLITINYLSILIILIFLLKLHLLGLMDMTMDEILRLIFFQQIIKTLKTLMRFVRSVTYSRSRRMCKQYIKTFIFLYRKPHFINPVVHLFLCILVLSLLIAYRTNKSHNTDTFIHIYLILYINASIRWLCIITVIMIAMHIKNRYF